MNETDKTLLERAAKSAINAGYEIEFHGGSKSPMIYKDDGLTLREWNPLISLSDATELALLLDISVEWQEDHVLAMAANFHVCRTEDYIDAASKRLAYCRAVTRAAAAMYEGK